MTRDVQQQKLFLKHFEAIKCSSFVLFHVNTKPFHQLSFQYILFTMLLFHNANSWRYIVSYYLHKSFNQDKQGRASYVSGCPICPDWQTKTCKHMWHHEIKI